MSAVFQDPKPTVGRAVMKSSQKQNILRHLLYGPLCGQEDNWRLGNRIPARIHELRTVGFQIEKRTCAQGHAHMTHQWEYYLDETYLDGYVNLCADCGRAGKLRYSDEPAEQRDGSWWFAVKCSECGKGDWR